MKEELALSVPVLMTPMEAVTRLGEWFNRQGFETHTVGVTGSGPNALAGLAGGGTFPVLLLHQGGRGIGLVVVKLKQDGAVIFHKTGQRTTGWDADLHTAFLGLESRGLPVVVCFLHVGDGEARMERITRLPIANTWRPPRGSFQTASHFVLWEDLPLRLPLEASE